ncbi:uncharacterized protein CANTADRAFT_91685 [Suhomyces tanzawaensis NRRL Y-17324]|uniref:Uncharacterized protein n=1 Tax=Suhomyces tanzawaensis NRRL Y-17324 TaxID=984487 RepID=A0A1E4SCM5_9ASCO|nr:uncharacterized protein CANTADRAFT_91685 [Suhomyces tanzawaensis NRRL Y-17324]ODV77216.1 hypothetical protein CANTADRAFT_91685 [Suhomyces tanzawaensis NRRL Y-17324]
MSQVVEKLTSTPFHSKSVDHILSYSYVDALVKFLLSFSLINYVYSQLAVPAWDLVNRNIVSANLFIYKPLARADAVVDQQVLSHLVDEVALGYPTKYAHHVNVTYLKPTNDYLYDRVVNKYLPVAEYKFDEGISEAHRLAAIVSQLVVRLRNQVSDKSQAISKNIVSTYNEEIKSVTQAEPTIYNNLTASYNTATKTLTSLNESHIKPLRAQTQEYVAEVASSTRSKADSLITDAKQTINPALTAANNKGHELLNGSTISASA